MATTIVSSPLTVTVTENITLSGKKVGGTSTKLFTGIKSIDKRIMTITTTEAVIGTFSTAVASAGHYTAGNVRYMRFTNLDDANFITLTFRNQDNDEVAIKVDAGQSFIWNGDNANGMTAIFNATQDADAASSTNFGSLTNLQADADAASCDLEVFIASV